MLRALFIQDFAIVHKLDLAFAPGFSVLTGETGAGKSILIDALALALGERAEGSTIRHGCARAEVTAQFELDAQSPAAAWLQAQSLFDDGECVLRRIVERDKPTRGFINGRPMPMQMLRELGELLVDIHGQHEHQSLLKRDAQRELLDAYAGAQTQGAALAQQYDAWKTARARLDELTQRANERGARLDILRYQVQELETLNLGADELPRLEEEYARLSNGAELLQGVQELAHNLYEADEGALTQQMAQVHAKLEQLSRFDVRLARIATLVHQANIEIDEAAVELRSYADALDLDPQRLNWVDQRLSAAHDLARKHQVQASELPTVLARLQQELGTLEDYDHNHSLLEQEVAAALGTYMHTAQALTQKRMQAATRLAHDVSKQIQRLGMPGGRFEVTVAALSDAQPTRFGLEQVEFLVSANAGQPPRPLSKVASGGELSRISLALQVVTAGLGTVPTLIFDEVDVGIGGGVAEIVGQQLHALGAKRQVLCVTHLGQVAAQGDQHYQVSKQLHDGATLTGIQALTAKERVHEIARMIGGLDINPKTLALAQEMLNRVPA